MPAIFNKRTPFLSWVFTLNNPKHHEPELLLLLPTHLLLMGHEFSGPPNYTPHIQGVLTLTSPWSCNRLRNRISRVHWEPCDSVDASIVYCKKDGNWEEYHDRVLHQRSDSGPDPDPSANLPSLDLDDL